MVQTGGEELTSATFVGGTVICGFGSGVGGEAGNRSNTVAMMMMTAMIPTTIRYGVSEFFSCRTARQFGHTVRLDSMDAPQCGHVFLAMYSNVIFHN